MPRLAAPAVGSRTDRGDREAWNREADLAVEAGRDERWILPELRGARIGRRRIWRPEKGQALGAPEASPLRERRGEGNAMGRSRRSDGREAWTPEQEQAPRSGWAGAERLRRTEECLPVWWIEVLG